NEKLRVRAENIVTEATSCEREAARVYLEAAGGSVKLAITMILLNCDKEQATKQLEQAKGHIREAIKHS
ncbi:MAG: N-acetylmuramic acid 6-phosphate etherase, partial [Niameybacter sp.]